MTITVGIIGYGLSATVFHIPFVSSLPELFTLRYIVSRSKTKAEITGIPDSIEILRTSAELFSTSVDLVVITTSNDSHAPLCREAIKAGKHVIIEKPLSATLAEAEQLQKEADASGVIISVYQNRRWDSDFLTLQSLVKNNTLGKLVNLTSRFDRYRPQARGGWKESEAHGGGILLDLGSHLVDQTLTLFGTPATVHAVVLHQRNLPTDDYFFITLDYTPSGGPLVHLTAGALIRAESPVRFVANGTHGTWTKHGLDVQEGQLKAGLTPRGHPDKFGVEDSANWGSIDTEVNGVHIVGKVEAPRGTYISFYNNVAEAITKQDKSIVAVPVSQAVQVMKILALAKESSDKKVVIKL